VPLAPSPAAKQWSRPFRIDVCSVFARMPRYGPAGRGTHVTLPRRVAVQLRTSQHSCDSSLQKTFSEHRTLNPRVRGSSPWRRTRSDLGFHDSRSFFMCPFCPHVCSMFARPHGPSNPGHVKNGPSGRRGAAPRSLDQWSRPHAQGPRGHPESLFQCRYAQCNLLVSGTYGGYVAAAAPRARRLPARDSRGRRRCASRWRCRLPPDGRSRR
jgi:hypothetical protein